MTRSILALKYTPVSVAGGLRKAVGGFLRYIQHRDNHVETATAGGLDDYVRYVAHRDRTSPGGRVFGRVAEGSECDRKRLVEYVARSTKGLAPKWVQGRDGKLEDRQRAVYTFVLSPEDWRGLDLRRVAQASMQQLEEDTGGLGPWFAAEHRNTAHHHVHIVLAARCEFAPGAFRTVLVTRARLERMKQAMMLEISLQRGLERVPATRRQPRLSQLGVAEHRLSWKPTPPPRLRFSSRSSSPAEPAHHQPGHRRVRVNVSALARHYRRQMERELVEEQRSREREGWLR